MKLTETQEQNVSRRMTYILRHNPAEFGIVLDANGYCTTDELLQAVQQQPKWRAVTLDNVVDVVRHCAKQRFELRDGLIRARYGHSKGNIERTPSVPPPYLYHGTAEHKLQAIFTEGLRHMDREHVHLSADTDFASLAGARHGKLVLLVVDSEQAHKDEYEFYDAGHGVWLTKHVPPQYLKKKEGL